MVQVSCLVASCGLAAGWPFEPVAAQISVGTEAPPNAHQAGPFSSTFLCPVLPRTPQCCVSWEMLEVPGDVLGGSMAEQWARFSAGSCRRCGIYSLVFSLLAEKLKLTVPSLAGV